jgi:hypothetical protein
MDVTVSTASTSGWIAALLCLGVLCNGYFLYSFLRRRRFRRPHGPGFCARVQGRLVGRVGALAYRTEEGTPGRAEEVLLIEQDGRTISVAVASDARGVRAGSFLCADGVPVVLLRDETLYRQPAEPGLLARRLIVGYWPELRWLRVPAAIGCLIWLLGIGCWFGVTASSTPSGRLFDRSPVDDVVPTSR